MEDELVHRESFGQPEALRQRCTKLRPCLPSLVAWLTLLAAGAACERPQPPPARPNVLLVVVDTLRWDHLGLYGYDRPTSTNLDRLASEAWVFDNHVASSAQTVPSTLSMLLSVHPAEHGFLHLGPGHFARNRPRYPQSLEFLQERFAESGYATAGFVGNPFLQRANGFAQGFDHFVYSRKRGARLSTEAIRWLRDRKASEAPFFVYLHYIDVHWPYDPPNPYRRRFEVPRGRSLDVAEPPEGPIPPEDLAATVALYDAGISYVDDQIGRVLGALENLGVRDDTIVAVTSDHGEEFLEHGGLGHGSSVYGELIRVPLLIAGPGLEGPGRRIGQLSHHLDLAPTLLTLAGLEPSTRHRGRSLTEEPARAFADEGPWLAVYADDRKLILDRETGAIELFELADRHDREPLQDPDAERRLLDQLRWYEELERLAESEAEATTSDWTDDEARQLEALGYAR